MAEKLFWAVFEHLSGLSPSSVGGSGRKRFAGKFKRLIHLVDSIPTPAPASIPTVILFYRRRQHSVIQRHISWNFQKEKLSRGPNPIGEIEIAV